MKNIKIIVGANFGDEGKGLMTDYFSSKSSNAIVVRFNGGAQAGHTVTTSDGKRHIFGHFGSGSFANLPTFLSEYFVVNPITFVKELKSLDALSISPKTIIDGNCLVTTPYDMIINQIAEITRGKQRHGSCGLGFNETIQRSLANDNFKITINDIYNENLLRDKLNLIKEIYIFDRIKALGIINLPEEYCNLLTNKNVIENYILDIKNMLNNIKIQDICVLNEFDTIIFEGAQGLLLDQNHSFFPHVTRSNTGVKNVNDILNSFNLNKCDIEIVYITRAYMTRHGAGPFLTEVKNKPYLKIEDKTNIPNPYQGTLRFGILDINELSNAISNDLINFTASTYNLSLAVTCLDQISDKAKYIVDSSEVHSSIDNFIDCISSITKINKFYLSYGPTRETIEEKKTT